MVLLVQLALIAARAAAHQPELSSLRLEAAGDHVNVTLRYTLSDVAFDPPAEDVQIEDAEAMLRERGPHWLQLADASGKELAPLTLPAGEIRFLPLQQECEWRSEIPRTPAGTWRIRLTQLPLLGVDPHEVVTVVAGGRVVQEVLAAANAPELTITWPAAPGSGAVQASTVSFSGGELFRRFVALGTEHILTGYDHLLYLAALILGCRRLGSLVGIVTCFTLAHSITLALAATGVVQLSPRVVEPVIAASIIYVAVENLWRRGSPPRGRPALAFGFGLVHGFGFAGLLQGLGLGRDGGAVLLPLFSFNLGVEAGQLLVLAIAVPFLWWARQRPPFSPRIEPALSGVIAVVGVFWFVQRTLF